MIIKKTDVTFIHRKRPIYLQLVVVIEWVAFVLICVAWYI